MEPQKSGTGPDGPFFCFIEAASYKYISVIYNQCTRESRGTELGLQA